MCSHRYHGVYSQRIPQFSEEPLAFRFKENLFMRNFTLESKQFYLYCFIVFFSIVLFFFVFYGDKKKLLCVVIDTWLLLRYYLLPT